ncbi:MAG TPA: GNAT family protein [Candidatus Rubrimentiphilum sp.]|nr:GNAT family protein [Candidatus Rubrimentiphilum sp.]
MLPTIETARLVLRPWRDADLDPWYEMNADPRVMEFFPATWDRARADAMAAKMRKRNEDNGYGWWIIEIKGGDLFGGVVEFDDITIETPFTPAKEIGWRLPVAAWGHGYATEAARAMLDLGFGTFGCDEIFAMTATPNTRSERVMQRLGMQREPSLDFEHPRIPVGHRLRPHITYRARRQANNA